MKTLLVNILAVVLLCQATAWGQPGGARSVTKGTPWATLTVRDFYRDPQGYCWIAADDNLLRCDGPHVMSWRLPGDHASANDYITAIDGVEGSYLLLGATSGLYRFPAPDSRQCITPLFGQEIPSVLAISPSGPHGKAIGTPAGAFLFDTRKGTLTPMQHGQGTGAGHTRVNAFAVDGTRLYALTPGGVCTAHTGSTALTCLIDDPMLADGTSVAVAARKVFAGTLTHGLRVYDALTGEYMHTVPLGCNVVKQLSLSRLGSLCVATDGAGIAVLDPVTERIKARYGHSGHGGTLSSDQVYAVKADSTGLLWAGHYQRGADHSLRTGAAFSVIDIPGSLDTHGLTVRGLWMSADGRDLALATRRGMYLVLDSLRTVRHIASPRLRSDMVLEVLRHKGLYYIATYGGGLQVYDPVADRVADLPGADRVTGDTPFGNGHIFSLAVEPSTGHLWMGTSRGVYVHDGARIVRHYDEATTKLPADNVYEIFFDSRSRGWLCTDAGMVVAEPGTGNLRTDVWPRGFAPATRPIRRIYEDSRHNLYFLPLKGTLAVSSIDLASHSDVPHSLLGGAELRSIVEDKEGNMWLTTDKGLYRWDKASTANCYGMADGVPNTAFISGDPVMAPDGRIWLGNPDGLLTFDPAAVRAPMGTSPISVTGVTVDGVFNEPERLAGGASGQGGSRQRGSAQEGRGAAAAPAGRLYDIKLDRVPRYMCIDFSDFNFTPASPDEYEYSQDGGKTWKTCTDFMSCTLYNIDSGTRCVLIRNANNPGNITRINLSLPMAGHTKAIVGLGALVLFMGIMLVLRYLDMRHLKLKGAARAEAGEASQEAGLPEGAASTPKIKYGSNRMTAADTDAISDALDGVMARSKPYLDTELSIAALADMAGVSSHRLSQYFSQHLGVSFYDYINRLRVEEFKRMVDTGTGTDSKTGFERYTLTALSEKSGFSSRTTFFRYFKKLEGITPAEYIKARTGAK